MKTTRESKKAMYIQNYMEMYKIELAGTIFTEEGQEARIELAASNAWNDRKKDIENKADALMWGIIDAKARCNKTREAIKKALN